MARTPATSLIPVTMIYFNYFIIRSVRTVNYFLDDELLSSFEHRYFANIVNVDLKASSFVFDIGIGHRFCNNATDVS